MDAPIQTLHEMVSARSPGGPLGLYLTGSSCDGGLRPDSDLDILLITRVTLHASDRRMIIEHLLRYSGKRATTQPGRPIELTSLVLEDINPWRYPAVRDFLYGEWLRDEYEAGVLPHRVQDPNLPVILTSARSHSSVLMGRPLAELTEPVPREDLAQSMFDTLPSLLDDLVGDERNVLLTLARILFTLRTGVIAPKDVAAAEERSTLPPAQAHILDLAAQAYRGEIDVDWTDLHRDASSAATALAHRINALRP